MTANSYAVGGAQVSLKAAFEDKDVWGQAAGSMTVPNSTFFALGQGIDFSDSTSNNQTRVYGVGSRNATASPNMQFSGTLTVNGTLSNVYWLLGALGAVADGGSGPSSYTHIYTETNVLPTMYLEAPTSFTTQENGVWQGAAINQATIQASINEVVKFTLECPYRYAKVTTAADSGSTDTQAVYTFAGGTIQYGGSTVANIQTIELTINNSVEMIYQVGSRFASQFVAKNREYNFKMTAAIVNFNLLKNVYGGNAGSATPDTGDQTPSSTMVLTFTNKDGHTIVVTLANVYLNESTLPRNVNEALKDDITGWALSCTNVVYTNATQNAPAEATNVS